MLHKNESYNNSIFTAVYQHPRIGLDSFTRCLGGRTSDKEKICIYK